MPPAHNLSDTLGECDVRLLGIFHIDFRGNQHQSYESDGTSICNTSTATLFSGPLGLWVVTRD